MGAARSSTIARCSPAPSPRPPATGSTHLDSIKRPVEIDIPGLDPILFSYDPQGRVVDLAQGVREQTFTYRNTGDVTNGYLETATDALLQSTTFVPDAFGRPLSQTRSAVTTAFGWDGKGNLTALTPPGHPTHGQTFTAADLLSTYVPPVVPGVSTPTTHYDYNLDRKLDLVTRPDGSTIDFQYHPTTGLLTGVVMPTSSVQLQKSSMRRQRLATTSAASRRRRKRSAVRRRLPSTATTRSDACTRSRRTAPACASMTTTTMGIGLGLRAAQSTQLLGIRSDGAPIY